MVKIAQLCYTQCPCQTNLRKKQTDTSNFYLKSKPKYNLLCKSLVNLVVLK